MTTVYGELDCTLAEFDIPYDLYHNSISNNNTTTNSNTNDQLIKQYIWEHYQEKIFNSLTIKYKYQQQQNNNEHQCSIHQSIRRTKLFDKIAQAQRQFLLKEEPSVVFGGLLDCLLEMTESDYGMIGELQVDEIDNSMYLLTRAVSNIAWNATTHEFYETNKANGLKFRNMDTLFGHVLVTGETVIANEPRNHPASKTGIPEGHPPLNHFLGIPFFVEGGTVISGMVGIANKPGGYTQDDVDFLEPLVVTSSNLIQAYNTNKENTFIMNRLEDLVVLRTNELQLANQKLFEGSKMQIEHFACMSHEIRTPLNCVIGLSSLLHEEPDLTPFQKDSLQMIIKSGELLSAVVNDVLDYSKLQTDNMPIEVRETSLQSSLDSVVHSIDSKAKEKLVRFHTYYDVCVPDIIETDSRRLQQILYNLLGNAIKFSKSYSKVELHISIICTNNTNNVDNDGEDLDIDAPVGSKTKSNSISYQQEQQDNNTNPLSSQLCVLDDNSIRPSELVSIPNNNNNNNNSNNNSTNYNDAFTKTSQHGTTNTSSDQSITSDMDTSYATTLFNDMSIKGGHAVRDLWMYPSQYSRHARITPKFNANLSNSQRNANSVGTGTAGRQQAMSTEYGSVASVSQITDGDSFYDPHNATTGSATSNNLKDILHNNRIVSLSDDVVIDNNSNKDYNTNKYRHNSGVDTIMSGDDDSDDDDDLLGGMSSASNPSLLETINSQLHSLQNNDSNNNYNNGGSSSSTTGCTFPSPPQLKPLHVSIVQSDIELTTKDVFHASTVTRDGSLEITNIHPVADADAVAVAVGVDTTTTRNDTDGISTAEKGVISRCPFVKVAHPLQQQSRNTIPSVDDANSKMSSERSNSSIACVSTCSDCVNDDDDDIDGSDNGIKVNAYQHARLAELEPFGLSTTNLDESDDDKNSAIDINERRLIRQSIKNIRQSFQRQVGDVTNTITDFQEIDLTENNNTNVDDDDDDDKNNNNSKQLHKSCSKYTIRFSVKDYGKGIIKDDFKKIFEPFQQASGGNKTNTEGTGLGLAITSRLVKGLGGHVSVDSEFGKWSKFTLDFPLSKNCQPIPITALQLLMQDVSMIVVQNPTKRTTGSRDSTFVDLLKKLSIPYTELDDCDKLVSILSDSKQSLTNNPNLVTVCIIQESMYKSIPYKLLSESIPTVLVTNGPKYSVKDADCHFRSLSKTLPSVLFTTIGNHVKDARLIVPVPTGATTDGSSGGIVQNNVRFAKLPKSNIIAITKRAQSDIENLSVLIAEDNLVNQKVLVQILKRIGIKNIDIVDNGQKAVDISGIKKFDIILMDMQMPIMGGVEATRIIVDRRIVQQLSYPNVVFVTAHATSEFEQIGKNAGGSGFISKPFDIQVIRKFFQALPIDLST